MDIFGTLIDLAIISRACGAGKPKNTRRVTRGVREVLDVRHGRVVTLRSKSITDTEQR